VNFGVGESKFSAITGDDHSIGPAQIYPRRCKTGVPIPWPPYRYVPLDHIQERIDTCIDTGVRRMGIELQGQERFLAHDVSELFDDKRVRTAAEIGHVDTEQVGIIPDEFCSPEDTLT